MRRRRRKGRRSRGTGTVWQIRPGVWAWRYFDESGVRRQCSGFATSEIAEEELRKARVARQEEKHLGRKTVIARSFGDVAEEYLLHARARHRETTARREEPLVRNILVARFGRTRVHEISRKDIQDFLAEVQATGRKLATRNRYLSGLKAIFEHAEANGYIPKERNPASGIKRPREPQRPAVYLSPDEQERLFSACSPRILPLVALAMDCGLRQGEVLGLTWPSIRLEPKGSEYLTVEHSKTGRPRRVPLSARCATLLREMRERRGPTPINGPDMIFGLKLWNGRLTTLYKAALRAAGLPEMTFHSLRSAYATAAAASGVSTPELMELLGHGFPEMSIRYAKAVPSDALERARLRMEAWRKSSDEGGTGARSVGTA